MAAKSKEESEIVDFKNLSAGEKLSLKGQLFELGKALSRLDRDKKQNDYSFQPTVSNFDLPNRQDDFLTNVQKAEAIRKQKLQIMKVNLDREQREGLTFSPVVNRKKADSRLQDLKPAHERLSEKAVEYRKRQEERVKKGKQFDLTSGKKLFQPELKPSSYVNLPSNITADEFLYRDARDREERLRQLRKSAQHSDYSTASSKKINHTSEVLLNRKAERELREIFDEIDQRRTGRLVYDDIIQISNELLKRSKAYERQYKTSERIWTVLDSQNSGSVNFQTFLSCLFPYACRNAQTMAWTDDAELTAPAAVNHPDEGGADIKDTNLLLKAFFKDMIAYVAEKRKNTNTDHSFHPAITARSKKLARIKDSKDKEQIAKLLSSSMDDEKDIPALQINSNTDLMFARYLLKQEKLKAVKENVISDIMEECTFKPQINNFTQSLSASWRLRSNRTGLDTNSTAPSSSHPRDSGRADDEDIFAISEESSVLSLETSQRDSQLPVHERLYAYKDRPRPTSYISESLVQQMQECTFAPDTSKSKKYRRASISLDTAVAKDFEKSVDRIKKAREDKLKRAHLEEVDHVYNDETYKQSRAKAAKGAKPFHFMTNERNAKKQQKLEKKYRLFVDVRLGLSKVGVLKIRDGDDPVYLANCFGRIYGLDEVACKVLSAATLKSMTSHGVEVGSRGDTPDGIDQEISSLQSLESEDEDDSYYSEDYSDEYVSE